MGVLARVAKLAVPFFDRLIVLFAVRSIASLVSLDRRVAWKLSMRSYEVSTTLRYLVPPVLRAERGRPTYEISINLN